MVVPDFIPGLRIEFIAVLATMGLYGITCMQTFLYFFNYQRTTDGWRLRLLVSYLWLMDTIHQVITIRGYWVLLVLIIRGDNPFQISKEYLWAGFFTTLVALPAQLFFVIRIWQFANMHWAIPLFFVPCSLFQIAGYVAFLIICLKADPTSNIILLIEKLPMAFWGVQAAEDVLISMSLVYLLWCRKVSGGFRSTGRLMYRLTVFVINTGMWTSLCALFTIITLVAYQNIQIYVALNFVICPLYCNTVLANLNARGYLRGDNDTETAQEASKFGTIAFAPFRTTRTGLTGTTASSHTGHVDDLPAPSSADDSCVKLTELSLARGNDV